MTSVPRVLVVADDLTGAADAAAPFAAHGRSVSVALPAAADLPDVDVLALVTDGRWRPAEQAAERVADAVRRGRDWGADLLFVKVDSTLRGPVRSDVAAALAGWDAVPALATPAFPAQGRVVADGALLVHGERTRPRVADSFPDGVRVVDAATHEDLLAAARDLLACGGVGVGSAGLSRALAEVLPAPAPVPAPPRVPPPAAGVVVVVGTSHPATTAQVAELVSAGTSVVTVGPGAPAVAEQVRAGLDRDRCVVLTGVLPDGVQPDSPAGAELARGLGGAVAEVIAAVPGTGLVLTGGATALAVATALRASELRVVAEAGVGLARGELHLPGHRVPVVTKSGGFGERDALRRAVDALEDRS